MQRAAKHIMLSQIWFYTFLVVCFVLVPRNGTISFYGNLKRTIVPYAIAFLSSAYFWLRASFELHKAKKYDFLRDMLRLLAVLLLCVLATPFTVNQMLRYLHTIFSTLFFLTTLVVSGWFVFKRNYREFSILLALQTLGLGFLFYSVLAYPHAPPIQFAAELTGTISFAIILILASRKLLLSGNY